MANLRKQAGFTIIELLVVIVIVGILATIIIVFYNNYQTQTAITVLRSDLQNAASQLEVTRQQEGQYPNSDTGLEKSEGTSFQYTSDGSSYCLAAISSREGVPAFHIVNSSQEILEGDCGGGGGGITSISAGSVHSCAVIGGTPYCWGYGEAIYDGENALGNGGTVQSSAPLAVSTSGVLSGLTASNISASYGFSCATANGGAYCWGANSFYGQLGSGGYVSTQTPVAVSTTGVLGGKTVAKVIGGQFHSCAVASAGAYCWGEGSFGQLGNNTTSGAPSPVAVSTSGILGGKTVTDISGGYYHTCAVASAGAYCWGRNSSGQLGTGNTTDALVPVAVSTSGVLAGKTVTAIAAGDYHTCAVASASVYCWGMNAWGQLGDGSTTGRTSPVAVLGALAGKTVTAITASYGHTCAIADAQAYCWGENEDGQLGNGSTSDQSSPVVVAGLLAGKTVTALAAGDHHTCAIADAQAYCWGMNSSGQLGNGNTTGSLIPVAVSPAS